MGWFIAIAVVGVICYAAGYLKANSSRTDIQTDSELEDEVEEARRDAERQQAALQSTRYEFENAQSENLRLASELAELPEQVLSEAEARIVGDTDPDSISAQTRTLAVAEIRERLWAL